MSKKVYYRCENEYSNDPCQFAKGNHSIPDDQARIGVDGKPRCPGKTQSGKDCNSVLVEIPGSRTSNFRSPFIWGGIVLVVLTIGALAAYLLIGAGGTPLMKVTPATLIFPKTEAGIATADLNILNDGDAELVIERVEIRPPVFSTTPGVLEIEAESVKTLPVRFNSTSDEMAEGELLLYSNVQDSPMIIRLIANQDPWWVYRQLEKSSKILSTEP